MHSVKQQKFAFAREWKRDLAPSQVLEAAAQEVTASSDAASDPTPLRRLADGTTDFEAEKCDER